MSIPEELIKLAQETASNMQKRASFLYQEYLEAKKLTAEKKAAFESADIALNRLAEFQVDIGGQLQCPLCWMRDGKRSSLHAVHGDQQFDLLQCDYGHEYSIPSGTMRGR